MTAFTDLVQRLLSEGSVRLREPPRLADGEREPVRALMADAFAAYRLDTAGPAIAFAPETALHAVEWLALSCWFLLHRGEVGFVCGLLEGAFAHGPSAQRGVADIGRVVDAFGQLIEHVHLRISASLHAIEESRRYQVG